MSEVKKKVLVLGSKPDAIRPDVAFVHVYTANAAAILAEPYQSQFGAKLTAIVMGDQIGVERVREHVLLSRPDKLVFRELPHAPDPYVSSLHSTQIETLSSAANFQYQKAVFGLNVYRDLQVYPWFKAMKRFIGHITGRTVISGCSTGFFAIIYALRENPEAEVIFSGIGFAPGGHFYGEGKFGNNVSQKDILFIRHLPQSWYQRLYCTDATVAKRFGLQLWQGEDVTAGAAALTS